MPTSLGVLFKGQRSVALGNTKLMYQYLYGVDESPGHRCRACTTMAHHNQSTPSM